MAEAPLKSSGQLVATLLSGSWRPSATTLKHTLTITELEKIAPLLLASGAAALGWWSVRHTELERAPVTEELQQAYRFNTLQAALRQRTIEEAVFLLRAVGVEPIMVKGWAVARLYPAMGLRPSGDVDLCVRPEDFAAASIALRGLRDKQYEVDLHAGFDKFGGGSIEGFYERSQTSKVGGTNVRVLGEEDHLRVLSIHLLREGAWRPLWLCDIALMVESRSALFDWATCLTENRRQANWVICAIQAAHQLLGARVEGTPVAHRLRPLPRWLVQTILKEWETRLPSMRQRHRAPIASFIHYPAGVMRGLRHRWPNPIEATVSMGASFNRLPRLPFQFGNCIARTARFAARLPELLRDVSPEK